MSRPDELVDDLPLGTYVVVVELVTQIDDPSRVMAHTLTKADDRHVWRVHDREKYAQTEEATRRVPSLTGDVGDFRPQDGCRHALCRVHHLVVCRVVALEWYHDASRDFTLGEGVRVDELEVDSGAVCCGVGMLHIVEADDYVVGVDDLAPSFAHRSVAHQNHARLGRPLPSPAGWPRHELVERHVAEARHETEHSSFLTHVLVGRAHQGASKDLNPSSRIVLDIGRGVHDARLDGRVQWRKPRS